MIHNPRAAAMYARAVTSGVVAGMRSQVPFALMSLAANHGDFAAHAGPPLSLLRSPVALLGLGGLAVGELIFDKLPLAPDRHELGPMAGRLVLGAAAGAALTRAAGRSGLAGAVAGAVGAGLGADGGYHARVSLGRRTGVPDPTLGAMEDVLAVALGLLAVRGAGDTLP